MSNGNKTNTTPKFFFSYARKDCDEYLKRFFDSLCDAIQRNEGLDRKKGEISFRDIDDIELGNDWGEYLERALQHSPVLVSVYTPWYFKRGYCGREFQVFLDRQGVEYRNGEARGSEKIIPILWIKKKHLDKKDLPPRVAKKIQYTPGKHKDLYEERGMRGILIKCGRRPPFTEIVEDLADRILEVAEDDPLPPAEQAPSLEITANAFYEAGEPAHAAAPEQLGPEVFVLVYLLADHTLSAGFENWKPVPDLPADDIHSYLGELGGAQGHDLAEPRIHSSAGTTAGDVIDDLVTASNANAPALLMIDKEWLDQDVNSDLLGEVLANKKWRGGLIVLGGGGEELSSKTATELQRSWASERDGEEALLLLGQASSRQDLDMTVQSLCIDVLNRVTKNGPVTSPGTGGDTKVRPELHGPGAKK